LAAAAISTHVKNSAASAAQSGPNFQTTIALSRPLSNSTSGYWIEIGDLQ